MKKINKPIPINEEIPLSPYKTIMSKTDRKGIIEYANDYFMESSGYKEWELMGQPHNVIRHPDMPKVIFKLLWDRLNQAEPMYAFVKNLAKDGRYYWVIADFKTKINDNGLMTHYARRKGIPSNTKVRVKKLYNTLLDIEKKVGLEASEAYFKGLIESSGMNYENFILDLMGLDADQLHQYMSSEISDGEFTGHHSEIVEDAIKSTTKKKGFIKRLFS
jgi:PAS domain S-box-containing protein